MLRYPPIDTLKFLDDINVRDAVWQENRGIYLAQFVTQTQIRSIQSTGNDGWNLCCVAIVVLHVLHSFITPTTIRYGVVVILHTLNHKFPMVCLQFYKYRKQNTSLESFRDLINAKSASRKILLSQCLPDINCAPPTQ